MFQDVLYLRVDEDIKAFYMRLNEAGLSIRKSCIQLQGETTVNIQVFEALQLSWFGIKGQQDCCGHGCASTSHWRGRGMPKKPSLTGSHGCQISLQVIGGSQREERLVRAFGAKVSGNTFANFFLKIGV